MDADADCPSVQSVHVVFTERRAASHVNVSTVLAAVTQSVDVVIACPDIMDTTATGVCIALLAPVT